MSGRRRSPAWWWVLWLIIGSGIWIVLASATMIYVIDRFNK